MKITITGDTHGDPILSRFFGIPENYKKVIIVCGDFGYIWDNSKKEQRLLNKLKELHSMILFVPGNHENYDLLETYPVVTKFGGNVRMIANNIYQLMTGEIYNIGGRTFLALGGAESIDKDLRVEHKSWWRQEIPSEEEIANAKTNLAKVGNKVDYIISHTAYPAAIEALGFDPSNDKVSEMLQWFKDNVEFRHWYFGHMHKNRELEGLNTKCLFGEKEFLSY